MKEGNGTKPLRHPARRRVAFLITTSRSCGKLAGIVATQRGNLDPGRTDGDFEFCAAGSRLCDVRPVRHCTWRCQFSGLWRHDSRIARFIDNNGVGDLHRCNDPLHLALCRTRSALRHLDDDGVTSTQKTNSDINAVSERGRLDSGSANRAGSIALCEASL